MTKNDSTRRTFMMLWLFSAALVTGSRFFTTTPLSLDLALQIEAAQNLVAGNGLTIYRHNSPNLAEPSKLIPLTIFTAGYSLYTAAILAMTGRGDIALRLLPAAATMIGWLGWARLAYVFCRDNLKRGTIWKLAGFLIALTTPLLFTVRWNGTDVYLWALVPWVLIFLVKSSKEESLFGARFDVAAGTLCGIAFLMRYASLFLAMYAGLLILWQARARLTMLVRRSIFFFLGFLPFLAVQFYINYFLARSEPVAPGALTFEFGFSAAAHRVLDGIPMLRGANYPWVFWFPGFALERLFPDFITFPWQLIVTLAILLFIVRAAQTYEVDGLEPSGDLRVAAMGLFIVFPILLWICMLGGPYNYVGQLRYYQPAIPLSIFVLYSMMSVASSARNLTRFNGIFQIIGVTGVACYLALSLCYIALFFAPGGRGDIERSRLLGSGSSNWPSLAMAYDFSPARNLTAARVKEEANTLLLASRKTAWFYGDGNLDRSRIHELSCGDYLTATYIAGPAHVVFLTYDRGETLDLWGGTETMGGSAVLQEAKCFERLPNLRLLQRFPAEGLKVLESTIPAGTRVTLRP